MEVFLGWVGNAWNWIAWHSTHMTLATGLWMGLAILTIVLLVLMRTRWGQVAPIWKCAVLSIFAHILLAVYAYSTQLIFEAPAALPSETFSITMVEPDAPNESTDEETTRSHPWDELDLSAEVSPDVVAAERLDANLTPDIKRTALELTQDVATPTNSFDAIPEIIQAPPLTDSPDPPADVTADVQPRMIDGSVEPQPIKITRQRREENEALTGPGSNEVLADRMNEEMTEPPPVHAEPVVPPDDPEAMQSLLQQLAAHSFNSPMRSPPLEMNSTNASAASSIPGHGQPRDGNEVSGNEENIDEKPRRLADGREMPELYSGRRDTQRLRKAREFGGTLETEQAVDAALRWLAANQEAAGNWNAAKHGAGRELMVLGHDRNGAGADADTGITGLALLAFLAAGNSHLEGSHRETVQHGLEYLINQQSSDGNLAGNARLFARMYCHAMAMLALGEALAVTGDRRLEEPVRRAVEYSLRSQDRHSGGWRYRPGDQGDMSQFGWQVMSLKSARLGGIEIPEEATRLMTVFLQSCTSGRSGGLAGYRPGQPPSPTMTAEALLCRHFIYQDVADATDAEAAKYLLLTPPGTGEVNYYYWYYGTLAMFHVGGTDWENWNRHMTQTLTSTQIREGEQAGSWEPTGVWCGYGGRVYSTALATLSLEVYYRYSQ